MLIFYQVVIFSKVKLTQLSNRLTPFNTAVSEVVTGLYRLKSYFLILFLFMNDSNNIFIQVKSSYTYTFSLSHLAFACHKNAFYALRMLRMFSITPFYEQDIPCCSARCAFSLRIRVCEFQPKGSDASASNSAWELHDEKSICALVNEKQVDVMG